MFCLDISYLQRKKIKMFLVLFSYFFLVIIRDWKELYCRYFKDVGVVGQLLVKEKGLVGAIEVRIGYGKEQDEKIYYICVKML